MHCSANVQDNMKNAAIFFGLSGTGKTTLSTDPDRPLVGDDEHGWSDDGIFNFEGGCYAKVINLNPNEEPDIYNAIGKKHYLKMLFLIVKPMKLIFQMDPKQKILEFPIPLNTSIIQ